MTPMFLSFSESYMVQKYNPIFSSLKLMSQVTFKKCLNCRNDVPQSNFQLHEIYCAKNFKKCQRCSRMYDINHQQQHHQQFHYQPKCQFCLREFQQRQLSRHLLWCRKKLQYCQYCQLKIPSRQYGDHRKKCEARTDLCEGCNKFIKKKEWNTHKRQCNLDILKRMKSVDILKKKISNASSDEDRIKDVVSIKQSLKRLDRRQYKNTDAFNQRLEKRQKQKAQQRTRQLTQITKKEKQKQQRMKIKAEKERKQREELLSFNKSKREQNQNDKKRIKEQKIKVRDEFASILDSIGLEKQSLASPIIQSAHDQNVANQHIQNIISHNNQQKISKKNQYPQKIINKNSEVSHEGNKPTSNAQNKLINKYIQKNSSTNTNYSNYQDRKDVVNEYQRTRDEKINSKYHPNKDIDQVRNAIEQKYKKLKNQQNKDLKEKEPQKNSQTSLGSGNSKRENSRQTNSTIIGQLNDSRLKEGDKIRQDQNSFIEIKKYRKPSQNYQCNTTKPSYFQKFEASRQQKLARSKYEIGNNKSLKQYNPQTRLKFVRQIYL